MSRYIYKWVGEEWGIAGVIRNTSFRSVTIHHSAVQANVSGYNPKSRAQSYAAHHRKNGWPGISYHFFIPFDNSNIIYITNYAANYVSGHTWHNGNYAGNQDSLAVLVDGNFEIEKPTEQQLLKLKQLMDDLDNNWFTKNGWFSFEKNITPKNPNAVRSYTEGIVVPSLHYHNEIAQRGHGTACCGKNLIPYIKEYRNKRGAVSWDKSVQKKKEEEKKIMDKLKSENKNLKAEIEKLKTTIKTQTDNILELSRQLKQAEENLDKAEFDRAKKEIEQKAYDELTQKNETLKNDLENAIELNKKLSQELKKLSITPDKVEVNTGSSLKDFRLKFAHYWDKLPQQIKYIIPNVVAAIFSALIAWLAGFDVESMETTQAGLILAGAGLSFSTIKSMIIAELRKLGEELNRYLTGL